MKEYQDLNDYELMYMVSENDDDAKDALFDKYKPLITKMAYKYYEKNKIKGLEVEDFIQEGYYALYSALSNYSDNKDCLFYTYVIRSIKSKMLNLCKRYKSKKNMILNESISLDTNVSEDSTLLDYIVNRDSPNPVLELDNSLFYNKLKELVYCESLIKGSIFELKLNGFTNKAISVLLDMNMCIVSRYFLQMKNKLKTILNYN